MKVEKQHTTEEKTNVLYVDDEAHNLVSFTATYRFKYNVFTAISGVEALSILEENEIHILITDQRMPGMTGVELLQRVIPSYPEILRILLTAYTDFEALKDAVNFGKIFAYMQKPWEEPILSKNLEEADAIIKKSREEKEYAVRLAIINEQFEFLLRQKLLS